MMWRVYISTFQEDLKQVKGDDAGLGQGTGLLFKKDGGFHWQAFLKLMEAYASDLGQILLLHSCHDAVERCGFVCNPIFRTRGEGDTVKVSKHRALFARSFVES